MHHQKLFNVLIPQIMQKILFLWCFYLLSTNTFAQFTTPQQVIDQLNGNWQWTMAQGGFAGETITPASLGMTASYHITQNPTDIGEDSISIQTYANGELIAESKAKLVVMPADGWAISGADLGITIFGGGSIYYPIFTLNNTYLILNDNIGDGYTYYFEKININITTFATPTSTCNTCDGIINVNVSNGTAPYAYTWSNGSTTQEQANLCAGTYTLTVTDADGNTATASTIVNGAITITLGNYSCEDETTANTSITISGGVPPYTVSSTGIYDVATSEPLNFVDYPFDGGIIDFATYEEQPWSFTIVDANGCTSTKTGTFDLPNPSLNPISAVSTSAPVFTIYENNYTNTGTNLNGQFFSSVAGAIDNNDGYSASIDPFTTGPGYHSFAYCTEAQNGGGAGFGEGFYEDGCSICAEQLLIVYPSFDGGTGSGNPFVEIGVNNTGSLQADVLLPSTCTTNAIINLSLTHLDDVESLFASLELAFDPNGQINEMDDYIIWSGNGVIDNANGTATFNAAVFGTVPPGGIAVAIQVTVGYPGFETTYIRVVNVVNPSNIVITPTTTPTTTCNTCDGTIDIAVDSGTAPYTYIWSNGSTTEDQTNLCVGTYIVNISDDNGIYTTQSINVGCPNCTNPPVVALSSYLSTLCNSVSEGNTTLNLNNLLGTSTLGGVWSGVGVSGNTFSGAGLAAGNYFVTYTISATANCPAISGTRTLFVTDCDPTPIAMPDFMPVIPGTSPVTVNVLANDTDNGSIILTNAIIDPANGTVSVNGNNVIYTPSGSVTTGSIDITYTIQDNAGQTATGTLTVLFSDCLAYAGDIDLIVNFIGEDNLSVYCSDALINLSQTTTFNSDANFTQVYLVTDTLGNIAQIHNTLPIPAPPAGIWKIVALNYQNGNITGLVVDNNLSDLAGCYNVSYSDKFLILSPIEITYTIEYVGTDQIVHVQVSGGYPAYYGYVDINVNLPPLSPTYDLDLGYASFELTFPCDAEGPFNFAIYNDGSLCDEFITVNLIPNCPPPININIEITSTTPTTTCNTCDGTIDIAPNGGTAPYAYTWSNGNTTEDQINLCAGTYTLTVTDANSNTATVSVIVSSLNTPVISNILLDCNLGASSITVFATDPNGETLEYALNGSNYQSSNTFTTIPNGNYTVAVRNTNSSCVVTESFVVDCFPIINITPTSTPTSTCNMCDATISIAVDGGTTPYAYLWSNGSIAQNQNTLCTGIYTVTVTDNNGNTATQSISIINPEAPTISNINVDCNDATTTVTVTASTPNGEPLEYAINGVGYQSANGFTTVADGTYPMFVRNTATGCISVQNFTVACLSLDVTATATPTSLCGACNGAINVSVSGGNGALSYIWNTGANFPDMVNLCAGTYTITVTDATGTTGTAIAIVNEPTPPSIGIPTIIDCTLPFFTLDPGSGFSSYLWNTGNTTQTYTATNSGTYTVTVTANNNCTATAQSILTINCGAPSCNYFITGSNSICQGQSATLNAIGSGLIPPLSYQWSTGETTPSITVTMAGLYGVTVSDALGNNCAAATTLIVNPTPNVAFFSTCNFGCIDCIDCSDAPYSYNWSNGSSNTCINTDLAGDYQVTVTNVYGCSTIVDAVVEGSTLAFQSIDVLPACDGNNGSICVSLTGGFSPYSYLVTNSLGQTVSTSPSLCANNLPVDSYTIYITDANGCTINATVSVLEQNITVNQQTYSCGQASMTFTAFNNAANYQWSTGETTNTITVTDYTQSYNVTVTGTNGCTSVYGYGVADVAAPIVNLSDALACDGETITLDAGTEGVTYQWSTGADTPTIDVTDAGWYVVTVTNFTGCTTIDSAFVSVDCNLYPGDGNNDGIANYLDLLSIGNHFNQTGAARIDASNNWTPQALTPWGVEANNGMDIGYTDCNGDGTINAADTTAIALNYGNEHQAVIINAPQNFNVSLQANPANEGFVDAETAVIPFDVVISNTNNTPLNEIYGIGFKLHYTSPTPASMAVAFQDASSGWMSYLGDASSNNPDNQILTITRNFVTSDTTGEVHIALTKVNGQAIEGTLAGVCRVIATVTIDTWGLKSLDSSASSPIPVTFSFDGITLTTADGTTYQQASSVTDTLLIPTIPTGINNPKQETTNWVIYPNPANDYVTIFVKDAKNNNAASNINIYDVTGRLVLSKPINANQHTLTIPTNSLNSGLYYCWYGNSVQKLLISK